MLNKIYQLAIPPEIKGGIYTEKQAVDEIKLHLHTVENVLLLLKNPTSAPLLFQAVNQLPKELNIGPMSSRKGSKKATLYAYLTDEEIAALNKLTEMDIRVYFNQVIDQKTEEWIDIKDNIK